MNTTETMTNSREGRCLCGAVRIEVAHLSDEMSACHCTNCQRWNGGAFLCVDGQGVTASGPVKTHAATGFSERAWCDRCGSALWIHDHGSDTWDLMPGLFPDLGGARLVREVYADRCPPGLAFAGDIQRTTAAEYEAANPHVTGEPS